MHFRGSRGASLMTPWCFNGDPHGASAAIPWCLHGASMAIPLPRCSLCASMVIPQGDFMMLSWRGCLHIYSAFVTASDKWLCTSLKNGHEDILVGAE